MKTGPVIVTLIIIVLVAGYYLVATAYFGARQENTDTVADVTAALQTLSDIPISPADLDQRLEEARQAAEDGRSSWPEPASSAAIVKTILNTAKDSGVAAIPLINEPWTAETSPASDIRVFRISLSVTGSYDALQKFLGGIETSQLQPLVIETVTVNRSGEEAEAGTIYADVTIVLYAVQASAATL